MSAQPVSFQTPDGVTISADFLPGTNGQAVILAHMFSRDRTAWGNFPDKLNQAGYTTLNIDLRGHGQSITQNGQPINFQNLSEEDFNKIPQDLRIAKDYLAKQGVNPNNICLIGASIGANAALIAAVNDPDIKSIVLLSPGENYHGVKPFDAAKKYSGRRALIISSNEDAQSFEPSKQIASLIGPSATFIALESSGHGNEILTSDSSIEAQIFSFLQKS